MIDWKYPDILYVVLIDGKVSRRYKRSRAAAFAWANRAANAYAKWHRPETVQVVSRRGATVGQTGEQIFNIK